MVSFLVLPRYVVLYLSTNVPDGFTFPRFIYATSVGSMGLPSSILHTTYNRNTLDWAEKRNGIIMALVWEDPSCCKVGS